MLFQNIACETNQHTTSEIIARGVGTEVCTSNS